MIGASSSVLRNLSEFTAECDPKPFAASASARLNSRDSWLAVRLRALRVAVSDGSNLVDSASSHTLVSKIKPCMSKYKRLYTVKLRMAHYISYSLFDSPLLHGYP